MYYYQLFEIMRVGSLSLVLKVSHNELKRNSPYVFKIIFHPFEFVKYLYKYLIKIHGQNIVITTLKDITSGRYRNSKKGVHHIKNILTSKG